MAHAYNQTSRSVKHAAIAHSSLGTTPTTAGVIFTTTVACARTALAMAAISLLMLIAMACGNEGDQTTPEQSEQTDQGTPARTTTLTGSRLETTATVVSSPQPEANAPSAQPGGTGGTSTTATRRTGDSAEPSPTAAALSPERAREAKAHYEVAEFYLQQRRYHRALQRLDQAIAINPDLAEAYTLRGLARTALHDYEGGFEDLNRAIDLEAKNMARAYAFRSYAHSELGNYDQAIKDANQIRGGDKFAEEDAEVALFTAHYRMGNYAESVRYNELPGRTPEYYSLGGLYAQAWDLPRRVDTVQEIDASLLLQPNDASLYHRRGTAHQILQWHAQAAEDFTKALELYGSDAPKYLHTSLAEAYLELGQYEQVVETLSQVDVGTNAVASSLLAYTYLRLGQLEDATRSIDAIDYGFDAPDYRGQSGREAWFQAFYNSSRIHRVLGTHFILKGAIYAANGNYDEGVKYFNLVDCPSAWSNYYGEYSPGSVQPGYAASLVLKDLQREGQYLEEQRQALWQWCGYPQEFVSDPDSGVWATALTEKMQDWFFGGGPVSTPSRDSLVIGSDNVGLLRYMTELYRMRQDHSIEALETTERIIELDPSIADAYRVQAELYLTTFPLVPQSLHSIRAPVIRQRYERAVAAWEEYEALATPEPEVAADHYFARGAALAELERKEEAQSAYQKAFELGYDEDEVKKALVQLNQ